jgi:hypothetical protein
MFQYTLSSQKARWATGLITFLLSLMLPASAEEKGAAMWVYETDCR